MKDVLKKDTTLYSKNVYGCTYDHPNNIAFFMNANSVAFDSLDNRFQEIYDENLGHFFGALWRASKEKVNWVSENFSLAYNLNEFEKEILERTLDWGWYPLELERAWIRSRFPEKKIRVKQNRSVAAPAYQ